MEYVERLAPSGRSMALRFSSGVLYELGDPREPLLEGITTYSTTLFLIPSRAGSPSSPGSSPNPTLTTSSANLYTPPRSLIYPLSWSKDGQLGCLTETAEGEQA